MCKCLHANKLLWYNYFFGVSNCKFECFHLFVHILCRFVQIPATLAHVEALEAYTQISSHPFHKTNKQDIISLDILYSKVWFLNFIYSGNIQKGSLKKN